MGRDRVEDAVNPRLGGGLVDDRLEPEPERRGAAGPAPEQGRVLLAADRVVRLDPAGVGAADVLGRPERLAGRAGRVGEPGVGGHDHHPVVGEQLAPRLGDLVGAAEPLVRVDRDRVGHDEADLDGPEHGPEARTLPRVPAADAVVPVGLDVVPRVPEAGAPVLDGIELPVGAARVLPGGAHPPVPDVPVRERRVVLAVRSAQRAIWPGVRPPAVSRAWDVGRELGGSESVRDMRRPSGVRVPPAGRDVRPRSLGIRAAEIRRN